MANEERDALAQVYLWRGREGGRGRERCRERERERERDGVRGSRSATPSHRSASLSHQSQFPHKSVNLSFIIIYIKNKLTNLY